MNFDMLANILLVPTILLIALMPLAAIMAHKLNDRSKVKVYWYIKRGVVIVVIILILVLKMKGLL